MAIATTHVSKRKSGLGGDLIVNANEAGVTLAVAACGTCFVNIDLTRHEAIELLNKLRAAFPTEYAGGFRTADGNARYADGKKDT